MAIDAEREDIINYSEESKYIQPKEEDVRQKLEWFRDQKLALMVHWGPYSELGLCESWPLSDEDAVWSREGNGYTWEKDPEEFRRQYFSLNKAFYPLRFQPEEWADFAKEAGFRYLIFTTKHHDGFCMYDSKFSPYKVTGSDCPFHDHKYANIAKHLFDAFRKKGIGIAAYFSKPDWHCPWYWAKDCELPVGHWRNPTYDPWEKKDLWEEFIQFTHNQMLEIVNELGPIDILWLDGGQVNSPRNHQNIRLEEVAREARRVNPSLLFADRTEANEFENYITPEQQTPDHYIPIPWESCVTIGHSFSFNYEDVLKSRRELIHLLVDIVGKGGNLALNIGAQPDGRLPLRARERAMELGDWLKINGEAIYGTRALPPYFAGELSFTQNQENRFALWRLPEGKPMGEKLLLPLRDIHSVTMLGSDAHIRVESAENGTWLYFPQELQNTCPDCPVFKCN